MRLRPREDGGATLIKLFCGSILPIAVMRLGKVINESVADSLALELFIDWKLHRAVPRVMVRQQPRPDKITNRLELDI